jgi:hypothetical protein
MSFSKLSLSDQSLIHECIAPIAKGPFLTDYELQRQFGVTREELIKIACGNALQDDSDRSARAAIGNSLLTLLHFPHGQKAHWHDWIKASPGEVAKIEQRWRVLLLPLEYSSLDIYGPVEIGGKFYRVVCYTVRDGGNGMCCEVWNVDKWLASGSGPGCKQLLATPLAIKGDLFRAGVDCSPLPATYDPLTVMSDEPNKV